MNVALRRLWLYWYLLFSKCERISFIISVKVTFHTKLKIVSVHKGCRHDILLFSEAAFENLFSRRLCIINYFIKRNVALYHLQYRRTGFARPSSLARACASVCDAPCSAKLLLTDVRIKSILLLITEYEFSLSININVFFLLFL